MNAKQYLKQIEEKTDKIKEQEEYIVRLRASLGIAGIAYDKDRVQTSPKDKMSEVIAKIADEEAKLQNMKQDFIQFRFQVIDQIKQLDNRNHRDVLNTVYVDVNNLKAASKLIGFSYDYTRELHVQALSAFEKMFPQ